MLRKKNDDNDVVQGGYVGENWHPDYRRHEQASQIDIDHIDNNHIIFYLIEVTIFISTSIKISHFRHIEELMELWP